MNNKSQILLKKIKLIKLNQTKKPKLNELQLIKRRIMHNKNDKKNTISILEKQKLNDLIHLFRNSHNSDIDVKWTLSLRNGENDSNSKDYRRRMLKFNKLKPPSFFSRDVENFIKKKNERENSCDEIMLPNLIKYTGLFKKRLSDTHGTILNNRSLLNFELNLRKINNNNKTNFKRNKFNTIRFDKSPKWDNSILTIKKDDLKIMNYSVDSDKYRNNSIKEKFIMRPYKVLFNKVRLDNKSFIYRKKYIKDEEKAYNQLGDVYSFGPYNDNYNEKNYNKIITAMKPRERTQQNLNYNLNLRIYKKLNL